MPVHRTPPSEGNYFRVPNAILTDKNLSWTAQRLLIEMLRLPDTWDFSMRGLEKIVPVSRATLEKYVAELEKAGYLRRSQPRNQGGKFSKAEWTLYDKPVFLEGNPPPPGEPEPPRQPKQAPQPVQIPQPIRPPRPQPVQAPAPAAAAQAAPAAAPAAQDRGQPDDYLERFKQQREAYIAAHRK